MQKNRGVQTTPVSSIKSRRNAIERAHTEKGKPGVSGKKSEVKGVVESQTPRIFH